MVTITVTTTVEITGLPGGPLTLDEVSEADISLLGAEHSRLISRVAYAIDRGRYTLTKQLSHALRTPKEPS